MDTTSVEKALNQYKKIVLSKFSPKSIILYGSYAKGTAHKESDIDIAVVFDQYDGDCLNAMQQLSRMTRKADIRIEPILLEEANDQSGFLQHVKKTGKVIYEVEK